MADGRPFTTFNFLVELRLEGEQALLCDGAFSECDGLEISHEPKTIREGGSNARPIYLVGPVSYGRLTLKRGMSRSRDLWRWFERVQQDRSLRVRGVVRMESSQQRFTERVGASGQTRPGRDPRTDAEFVLTGCLPVKLKAPSLNAKDGQVAIEELQIAYETLVLSGSEA